MNAQELREQQRRNILDVVSGDVEKALRKGREEYAGQCLDLGALMLNSLSGHERHVRTVSGQHLVATRNARERLALYARSPAELDYMVSVVARRVITVALSMLEERCRQEETANPMLIFGQPSADTEIVIMS
jgi:hypothetical protein